MDGGPSEVFSKINPSFFTIKEGSTSLSKPLPSQKGKDVPTALLGAQTASLYGWRTIRGLRQQRSCGFLCGDEPALLKSSLWERRDIRIDACRWERLAECSQKPFGLHLSPNSTPYIRPIYFWRFFLLVVN